MRVRGTRWFGIEPVEFTDNAGNTFNTQTGVIRLHNGSEVTLNRDARVTLTNAVNGILARDSIWVGALTRVVYPEAPENIIELAGSATLRGQSWNSISVIP